MSSKRFNEVKNLSKDELAGKARELEAGLFQARMKRATGQLANVASIWSLRKDLARVKMLQTQAERAKKSAAKA